MPKRNLVYVALIVLVAALALQLDSTKARHSPEYTLFDPIVDVYDIINKNYVAQTEDQKLINGSINGMLHTLDFYSEFIPAEEVDDFQKQTSGSYEGIGIGIDTQDGFLTVISPFENSPADKAGIRAGDVILEVNGQSTKGWSNSRAVKELTGGLGSSVTLRLLRQDGIEENVSVVREEVHVPTVRGWRRTAAGWDYLLDDAAKIGYLRITQFTGDTIEEMDRAIAGLLQQKMEALILDLRNNPGGLMSSAVDVVDRMIDEGVIVSTRGAHTEPQVIKAHSAQTYPRFPLVVLIDQGSASGSEIVAGSLQDHGRAVIVGERSWGKGSVQRTIKLPDSGAIVKLTTDYYYLPKGRCVHRLPGAREWGVAPDVEEALDPNRIDSLRAKMETLMRSEPPQPRGKEISSKMVETKPVLRLPADPNQPRVSPERLYLRKQAKELLELDNQLAQALKQCKGLTRAQPGLPALAGPNKSEAPRLTNSK